MEFDDIKLENSCKNPVIFWRDPNFRGILFYIRSYFYETYDLDEGVAVTDCLVFISYLKNDLL